MTSKIDPSCNFSLGHYRYCLQKGLDENYRFLTMQAYVKGAATDERIIIMRHDEDLSLEAARRLADVEAALGIRSSFFFRLHACQYNLLSLPSLAVVTGMQQQGHEIGLHGETHALPQVEDRDKSLLRQERELLSRIIGTEVTGLSVHEPFRIRKNREEDWFRALGFEYEAYSSQFTPLKYISDSSAYWREGCMCQHIGRTDQLYILTHGFWWYDKTPLENY
ncbi:MAG: hypothetical protein ACETWG_07340 [Candidatus Neomarinimicrobiota bacterium]